MKKVVVVTNAHRGAGTPILVAESASGKVIFHTPLGVWVVDLDKETIDFPWGIQVSMRQELLDHYGATFGLEFSS